MDVEGMSALLLIILAMIIVVFFLAGIFIKTPKRAQKQECKGKEEEKTQKEKQECKKEKKRRPNHKPAGHHIVSPSERLFEIYSNYRDSMDPDVNPREDPIFCRKYEEYQEAIAAEAGGFWMEYDVEGNLVKTGGGDSFFITDKQRARWRDLKLGVHLIPFKMHDSNDQKGGEV